MVYIERTFISLFGGCGGFDLAFKRHGWKSAFYNDIDKHVVKIYNKDFSETYEPKDIRKIDANDIPEHTLLCAGFPCQSFSIAGKRKGFADTRGTLFFEICRIAKAKRTPYLLLENVKELLSHDEGKTFGTIVKSLDELGYDIQWQVLNSRYFGVPQNRERVFIVANLRGFVRPKVFPITEDAGQAFEKGTKKRMEQVAQCLKARDYANGGGNFVMPEIAGCLTGGGHSGGLHSDMTAIPVGHTRDKNGNATYHPLEIFGTLKQPSGNQENYIFNGLRIRRLTPTECERLQGFPDGWTKGVSDTQRYKMLGNAVTVPVVEAIVKRLNEVEGGIPPSTKVEGILPTIL